MWVVVTTRYKQTHQTLIDGHAKWPKMVTPGPGGPWGAFSDHFGALGGPGGNFFLGPGPLFHPLFPLSWG